MSEDAEAPFPKGWVEDNPEEELNNEIVKLPPVARTLFRGLTNQGASNVDALSIATKTFAGHAFDSPADHAED